MEKDRIDIQWDAQEDMYDLMVGGEMVATMGIGELERLQKKIEKIFEELDT